MQYPGRTQTMLARHCIVVGLVMLGACRPSPAPPTPLEEETAERRALIAAMARDPSLNEGGEIAGQPLRPQVGTQGSRSQDMAGRAKVSRDQRPR
jgi:hypothetical protein